MRSSTVFNTPLQLVFPGESESTLRLIYIGKYFGDRDRQQADYVLALATLGSATKNRNDPISVTPPKVAKASPVTMMLLLALSC
jgi:hypothetical protein